MFSIPTIPPDLRHEETIVQAAFALDCLHKTINLIFEKIDRRIKKNNDEVNVLDERIKLAQSKIKGLVGTKKAIKISAPSRFPPTDVFNDIPVTFSNHSTTLAQAIHNAIEFGEIHESLIIKKVENRVEIPEGPEEKLIFFHVRSNKSHTGSDLMHFRMQAEEKSFGKAKPDGQLRSVPSLLLFNTEDCVYAEHSDKVESWQREKLSKLPRQQCQGTIKRNREFLEPAPQSLTNRNHFHSTPAGELRYFPKGIEAPEIDLPMDLPDLPGIAEDIYFEGNEQQIAPSFFSENLPDLEELEGAFAAETTDKNANDSADVGNGNNGKLTMERLPPPPPPPPLPSLGNNTHQSITSEIVTYPQVHPPTLPPPPLPISQQATEDVKIVKKIQPKVDVHTALMDAIRRAGGTRGGLLRTTSTATPADAIDGSLDNLTNSRPSCSFATVRGDFMSDLHNKLQMRRKGISGANGNVGNRENESVNSNESVTSFSPILTRLSALIPQTHMVSKQQNTGDEDDTEWTD